MPTVRRIPVLVVLLLTAVSCAQAAPTAPRSEGQSGAPSGQAATTSVQRALVIIGGRAPDMIAARPLRQIQGAGQPTATLRAFNAGLALANERYQPGPYLAKA